MLPNSRGLGKISASTRNARTIVADNVRILRTPVEKIPSARRRQCFRAPGTLHSSRHLDTTDDSSPPRRDPPRGNGQLFVELFSVADALSIPEAQLMGIPYGILAAAALTTWTMPVCLERGNDHQLVVERAQVMAGAIFKNIGLSVEWRDYAACKTERDAAIRVTLVVQGNDGDHPRALAYAHAFEGRHTRVLYDRVLKMGPERVVAVLAYVLVHEIAHVLLRTDLHSDTGIMKRRWNGADFALMQRAALFFTDSDVLLIHQGMNALGFRQAE